MKYSLRLPLKAYIILLSFLIVQQVDTTSITGDLPSIPAVANFLKLFIKPMIETQEKPNFRAKEDNSFINKIIYDKIKALKPLLQDNDPIEGQNTVTLEGEDDTHILEFLPSPKDALRFRNQTDDAERFKKMRKKIKKALNKEPISEDTKRFITKSVDEMVAHIVSNKCVWTPGKAALRQGNTEGKPFSFNDMWKHLWEKIQTRYKESGKGVEHQQNLKFLEHFQEFVSEILNDTQILSEDYRVVCSIINMRNLNVTGIHSLINDKMVARSKQRKNPDGLRAADIALDKKDVDGNETCTYFKICSEELSDFMADFYINLNDTAITTLSNYAAMFSRDVKEDYNNEKQTVIALIVQTSSEIAQKINIIFKKQTEKFTLDKNKDKDSNVNALRRYIKKTVNHVKRQVTNDVALKLRNLRPKLRVTIEKDIDVNLDVDLGNLEKELSTKICMIFEICNGKYVSRRNFDYTKPKIDKNHLFVRVQLTLDDNKKPDRRIALGVGQAMKNSVAPLYSGHVNVTRTYAPLSVSTIRTNHILVQHKEKLMSAEKYNQGKMSRNNHTDKHIKTHTKKWHIRDSLEIYNEKYKDKKTKLKTLNEHANKKNHHKKKHSVTKKDKKSKNKEGNNKFKSDSDKKYYKARENIDKEDTVILEKDNKNANHKTSTKTSKTKTTLDDQEMHKDKKTTFDITKHKHKSKKEHYNKKHNEFKNKMNATKTEDNKELQSENEKIYQKSRDNTVSYTGIVKSEEDSKENYNKTQKKVFKTIESLETYQEMNKDKKTMLNMTVHEHKKKHHSKTHNSTKKDNGKLGPTHPKIFKTIESLETYQELHKINDTKFNKTVTDPKQKLHHKTHNSTKKHKTKKKSESKTNHSNNKLKSDNLKIYQKARDNKQEAVKLEENNDILQELKFNMTFGSVGINPKHEETQKKLKSDDEIHMRAQTENDTKVDEELKSDDFRDKNSTNKTSQTDEEDDWDMGVGFESWDNNTDANKTRRGGRRYDLNKSIDNAIENAKFDTIRDDTDNDYSETNEEYYNSEYYSQSSDIEDQNNKKEFEFNNNEIDSLNNEI